MKVLVINAGSSSLKYQLIEMDNEEVVAKGLCERIGIDGHISHKTAAGWKTEYDVPFPTHKEAFEELVKLLTDKVDAAEIFDYMIREKMVDKKIVFSSNNKQNAESLGIIAYKKIKNGEFTDPDSVVPVYLRKSQAERLKDAKENS